MSVGADRIRQQQKQQQQQFNQNQRQNQNQKQQSTSATSPLPFFCRVGFASAAGIGAVGSGRDLLPLATCRRFLLCRLTTTTCSEDHGDRNGGNSQSNHHHHQYSHQHSNGEERNYEAVVGCDDVDEEDEKVGSFEQEQQQLASELVHLAPRQTAVQSYGSLLRV